MNSDSENKLMASLDENLRPYSFERTSLVSLSPGLPVTAAWTRKTWNTNRGIALVSLPEAIDQPGKYAQSIKMPLGRLLGYVLFFYPLGLQIILAGNSILEKTGELEKSLDLYDNQQVVLQSINVVDLAEWKSVAVRTWGQYETGRFQDAIENGIKAFLVNSKTG